MVVLSAAILSRTGYLLSRQFVEMTRQKIERLLSAFVKLIDGGGKDHTYLETDAVRYTYQPMEGLYLLLITNKQSNILEDIETLRLLVQVVQEVCQTNITHELVLKHAFDIIFSFDEVISFGYREPVTLSQIKDYTKMDSHEEKLYDLNRERKEKEEEERRNRIVEGIEKEKSHQKKIESNSPPERSLPVPYDYVIYPEPPVHELSDPSLQISSKGLQVGQKRSTPTDIFDTLSDNLRAGESRGAANTKTSGASPDYVDDSVKPVYIHCTENVFGSLHADGGLTSLDARGSMQITVGNSVAKFVALKFHSKEDHFKFFVPPIYDRDSFNRNTLRHKDSSNPLRHNIPVTSLTWRLVHKNEDLLPMLVTCWPTANPEGTTVHVEISVLDNMRSLRNIRAQFLNPPGTGLQVQSIHGGTTEDRDTSLHWVIPRLDSSLSAASLVFVTMDSSLLFPFTVEAVSSALLCNFSVVHCFDQSNDEPLDYAIKYETNFTFTLDS